MRYEKLEADILLVDDEAQFLARLAERLQLRGIKAETVTSGEDALALVQDKDFDAIVVDLAMPGLDGLETLRRLKDSDPSLQIIMLTGHGTVQSGVEAMKAGAADFLEKPVDLSALFEKIGQAKEKRMLVIEKGRQEEVKAILHSKSW